MTARRRSRHTSATTRKCVLARTRSGCSNGVPATAGSRSAPRSTFPCPRSRSRTRTRQPTSTPACASGWSELASSTRLSPVSYVEARSFALAVRHALWPHDEVDERDQQRTAERRPEAADAQVGDDATGQPEHERVDEQQRDAEREDDRGERHEDDDRAQREVDDPEDRAREQERAQVVAVTDRGDYRRSR